MSDVYEVVTGDCLDVLRGMADNSVDAVVTDPPYGLKFMGHRWDCDVPSVEVWTECRRVLKPGGYLLAFAGTRTQHRMACRIEDAGFEIRDMIAWVFGSGMPKSRTTLKPALEPITVARKPLAGTVAANVQAHGTGALNIDACRIGMSGADAAYITERVGGFNNTKSIGGAGSGILGGGKVMNRSDAYDASKGRWPANVAHDGSEDVLALFPESSSGAMKAGTKRAAHSGPGSACYGTYGGNTTSVDIEPSCGSASRFFYCAKVSRADRNDGLSAGGAPVSGHGSTMREREDADWSARNGNHHPTVKPTGLMRWLCRLVTPAGGTILDPFAGSGSTGRGAVLEGFRFIGIELDPEYAEIARSRIAAVMGTVITRMRAER